MIALAPSARHARRLLLGGLLVAASAAAATAQPAPVRERAQVRAGDGHALTVWVKRPATPPRGTILLLHGRTWSSLPNFDLQVPGQQVSLMDAFVARGYAVYALDQRGYGATPRDSSQWITPARAARDAAEVLDWIAAREPGTGRPALFGYSQGSMTAMLAAERSPASLSALVLYGFPLDLSDSARATMRSAPAEPARLERRVTTLAAAAEDFITPESTPAGVKDAYARAAVASDPVRSDWRDEREFATLDPAELHVPVLVINGERDPYAGRAHLGGFLAKVSGVDHEWVVLAHADHAAHLERQRDFADAVASFLERSRVATSGR